MVSCWYESGLIVGEDILYNIFLCGDEMAFKSLRGDSPVVQGSRLIYRSEVFLTQRSG